MLSYTKEFQFNSNQLQTLCYKHHVSKRKIGIKVRKNVHKEIQQAFLELSLFDL